MGSLIGGWQDDPVHNTAKDLLVPRWGRLGNVAARTGGRFAAIT